MPSLPELVDEFERTLKEVERLTVQVAGPTIGTRSHLTALQIAEAASDLCSAGRALSRAHRRGISVYNDLHGSAPQRLVMPRDDGTDSWVTARQPPELEELSFLIKAWLFFVSAFCDKAYRLLLGRIQDRAAPRGNMSAIEKEANPVGRFLDETAEEVRPWFRDLRAIRNSIKEGTNVAFSQLDARGLGITVYTLRAAHGPPRELIVTPGETITFADVVEDARRVRQLLELLAMR